MTLRVIGAGLGRTGTYSLKLALEQLGFGPCFHMEAVLRDMPRQVPLWSAAVAGRPDWATIYRGYRCAVDWPTAAFFRELVAAYPDAWFVLTRRSPESWADSFSATIRRLIDGRHDAPPEWEAWLDMCDAVIAKSGFPAGLERPALIDRFVAHQDAVLHTIPSRRLLVYDIGSGWAPLCEFLEVPSPSCAFPRSNDRAEFWDRVAHRS